MFLLFKTNRDEDVLINADKISYILKAKKGNAIIFDDEGNEFSSMVSYEEFMQQFFSKVPITKIYEENKIIEKTEKTEKTKKVDE